MQPATSTTALKVQALLGKKFEVLEFEESTRTASDAAAAIGCAVAQIAKALIFRIVKDDRAVLVVTSGSVRVDETKVATHLGEDIGRADADFVRDKTGFAIGGVPPIGHRMTPVVLIDETLLDYDEIWAAGGTPNAVFRLSPNELVQLTNGTIADVAE